jgi:hypothetical protein
MSLANSLFWFAIGIFFHLRVGHHRRRVGHRGEIMTVRRSLLWLAITIVSVCAWAVYLYA